MEQEIIQVEFWINDHIHAMRHTSLIPSIGDEVRFKNIAYKLHYKIWIYDDKYPRVAFNMQEVRPTRRALDVAKAPRKSKRSAGSPRK